MNNKIQNDIIKDFEENLTILTDERLKVLDDFREMQIVNRVFLQYEEKRIEKKFGKDHERINGLRDKLKHNLDVIKDLEIESELARIKVPIVSDDDTLIHGRITDKNLRGIGGLFVYMTSEKGENIRELGRAETDNYGYYSLVYNDEKARQASDIFPKELFITVGNKRCEVVYRDCEPIKINKGDRKTIEIRLNREGLYAGKPIKNSTDTSQTAPPVEDIEQKKHEDVKLSDIRGIGPASVKKLTEAGINNPKDFIEADKEKLKSILGKANISEMKKHAASLLEKGKKQR